MALYLYQAYGRDGKRVTGSLDASSPSGVREQLAKMQLYPISIEEIKDQASTLPWYRRIFSRSVSLKDKILFTKQLAVFLRSGVPLLQAMELLAEQFGEPLRSMLISIKDGIKEGSSLAQGLNRYPATFPNIYVQLVRAGEASGNLEVILVRLVEYLERQAAMRKKIKSALTTPMIQLVAVIVVVILLLRFVVPKIAGTFSAAGKQLPLTTRIVVGLSDAIINYWMFMLGGLLCAILAYQAWRRTPGGAQTIDTIRLKIPIIGYLTQMGAVVQFCRTLGMLSESGVNLSEALDIVVQISENSVLKNSLSNARDQIIKQGKIAEFLRQTNLFPPVAIYLIRTGEESGQLGPMLLTVAKNYDDDLSEFADSLSALLGPLMLVFMAVVVGIIVMAIMQPMLEQAQFS